MSGVLPSSPLERNVERLLARAYRPVRMREEFRAELVRAVCAALEQRASAGGAPRAPRFAARERADLRRGASRSVARERRPRLAPRALVAAAALVLALLGTWAWRAQRQPPRPLGLAALLASAGIALRDAPDAAWRAPSAAESAGAIALDGRWLEIRTGDGRAARLEHARAERIALAPGSHLVADGTASTPSLALEAGGLEAALGGAGEWAVRAAGTTLSARGGSLQLALLDDAARAAVAPRASELDPARAIARLEADGAALSLAREHGGALLAGADACAGFLQDGRFVADPAPDASGAGGTRDAIAPPPTPPEAPPAERWTLRGTLRTADGTPPPERVHVWVRPVVALPKVSEPVLHVVERPHEGFALEGDGEGEHVVHVEAAGFAAWERAGIALAPGAEIALDVELARGGAVTGFVLDAATGEPIPGALVMAERDVPHQVLALDGSFEGEPPLAIARTDARGAYALEHLSAGEHVLRASAPTHAAAWTRTAAVREDARVAASDLLLRSGARLHGAVTRADGSAWSDAVIIAARIEVMSALPCISYGMAVSDASGAYTFDHLPPGVYAVMNESEQPNADPEWRRLEQVVLREGEERRLDFHAGPTARVVRGTLRDASGAPRAGETLYLNADPAADDWRGWSATHTGPGGEFEFRDVAPDVHGLYRSSDITEGLSLLAHVDATGGGDVDVDVTIAATRIEGVARAAADGTPLTDGIVLALRRAGETWEFAGKTGTDAQGAFAFDGLPEGEYTLVAYDAAQRCADAQDGPFALFVGAPRRIELALEPGGAVHARVVGEDGEPIPGARVWCHREGEAEAFRDPFQATDGAGRIALGAYAPGAWIVRAEHPAHAPAELEIGVLAGERHEVEIVLRPR